MPNGESNAGEAPSSADANRLAPEQLGAPINISRVCGAGVFIQIQIHWLLWFSWGKMQKMLLK